MPFDPLTVNYKIGYFLYVVGVSCLTRGNLPSTTVAMFGRRDTSTQPSIEESFGNLGQAIEALVNGTNKRLESIDQTADELATRVAATDSRVTALEAKVTETGGQVTALGAKVTANSDQLAREIQDVGERNEMQNQWLRWGIDFLKWGLSIVVAVIALLFSIQSIPAGCSNSKETATAPPH